MSEQKRMTDSEMRACLDHPSMDEALSGGEVWYFDAWWLYDGEYWIKQNRPPSNKGKKP